MKRFIRFFIPLFVLLFGKHVHVYAHTGQAHIYSQSLLGRQGHPQGQKSRNKSEAGEIGEECQDEDQEDTDYLLALFERHLRTANYFLCHYYNYLKKSFLNKRFNYLSSDGHILLRVIRI